MTVSNLPLTYASVGVFAERLTLTVLDDRALATHEMTSDEAFELINRMFMALIAIDSGVTVKQSAAEFFEALRD